MTVTFYPKRLLLTAVFIVAFGLMLEMATDLRRGVVVGVLAVCAFVLIELLIVVNPAAWWRSRREQ